MYIMSSPLEVENSPKSHYGSRYVASIALSLAAIAGCSNSESSNLTLKSNEPVVTNEVLTDPHQILNSIDSPKTPTKQLLDLTYREVSRFALGERSVSIVEISLDKSNAYLGQDDLSEMAKNVRLFDEFAHSGATFEMPITEGDLNNEVVSESSIGFSIEPTVQDEIIFVVPESISLGESATGDGPNVFTTFSGGNIVSFVRPEANNRSSMAVEACQANVTAVLNRSDNITANKISPLAVLGQEELCNSLGSALYYSENDIPYSGYKQAVEKQGLIRGATNIPTVNDTAFYSSLPSVGSAEDYANMATRIPASIGRSLIFPPVTG